MEFRNRISQDTPFARLFLWLSVRIDAGLLEMPGRRLRGSTGQYTHVALGLNVLEVEWQ